MTIINVPSDKARAVADAMERDLATTLATKQDLELPRRDVGNRLALLEPQIKTAMNRRDRRHAALGLTQATRFLPARFAR